MSNNHAENAEQKYPHQIPLTSETFETKSMFSHLNEVQHQNNQTVIDKKEQPNEIELEIKTNPNKNEFKLKYIAYKLDHEKNEIIVSECSTRPSNNNTSNSICLQYKYRSELLMQYRKRKYIITLIPIYIIFIIYCIFIGLSIKERTNMSNNSYSNNHINTQIRQKWEFKSIETCGVLFEDIYGYFDGSSFNMDDMTWFDYSSYKNDIDSNCMVNKIKTGVFRKDINKTNDNLYIYGSKYDSINIPSSLNLNKNNYTIATIARYNGNDRNTIFESNDSKWV
eukprot:394675_1